MLTAIQCCIILPNDLILFFGIGSVSTAGAAIIKWGNMKLSDEIDEGVISQGEPNIESSDY